MSLISIVIPVYHNRSTLSALHARLESLSQQRIDHEFEFVYVDDGSTDDSFQELKRIAATDRRIKVIKLVRNFGANTAILAGMSHARGDCVGCLAADLQDPPETYLDMIQAWENGSRVVLAVRKNRFGDPFFTRIFADIFNFLFKRFVYNGFSPQGVGFFLLDRQAVNTVLECEEKNAHLIGLIYWMGFPITQVEYDRVEREDGKSQWTFQKKLKYFIDAFVAFSYLPLRMASTIGILLAVFGGIYAIVIVLGRISSQISVPGWTTLTVVVLLLSGVQLMILGIVGEYLWRNFDATRKRPIFIIDQVIDPLKPIHQPQKTKESVLDI